MIVEEHIRLRFGYLSDTPVTLPRYPGSAWRGAFGHSLREGSCLYPDNECRRCPLNDHCAYACVFETLVQAPAQRGINTNAPHPYTFDTPASEGPSLSHQVELNLIGSGCQHLSAVISAMEAAGRRGIARDNNILALQTLEYDDGSGWQPLSAASEHTQLQLRPPARAPERCTVTLTAPLRIKHGNRYAGAGELTPLLFFRTLLTRLHNLAEFHGRGDTTDYPAHLHEPLRAITFQAPKLHWDEAARYSSRQHRRHNTGGLRGTFNLSLHGIEALWPALWQGQYLHAGKLATMGHGAYRLQPQACE